MSARRFWICSACSAMNNAEFHPRCHTCQEARCEAGEARRCFDCTSWYPVEQTPKGVKRVSDFNPEVILPGVPLAPEAGVCMIGDGGGGRLSGSPSPRSEQPRRGRLDLYPSRFRVRAVEGEMSERDPYVTLIKPEVSSPA